MEQSELVNKTKATAVGVGLAAGGMIAGTVLGLVFIVTVVLAGYDIGGELSPVVIFISIASTQIGLFLIAIGYLYWTNRDLSFAKIRRPTKHDGILTVVGVVVIAVASAILNYLISLLELDPANNIVGEVAASSPEIFAAIFVMNWIFVAPAEELLFRGVIQSRIRESMSVWPSVFLAGTIFAVVHIPALTGGGIIAPLVGLAISGIVLGVVFEKSDSIVPVVLIHGLYNSLLFLEIFISEFGFASLM